MQKSSLYRLLQLLHCCNKPKNVSEKQIKTKHYHHHKNVHADSAIYFINVLTHPKFLQHSVSFAPVHTNFTDSFTHGAAGLVRDASASRVYTRALGSDTHGAILCAGAGTRCGARIINLSDAINKTLIVDTELAAIVTEFVFQLGFGRILWCALENEALECKRDAKGERSHPYWQYVVFWIVIMRVGQCRNICPMTYTRENDPPLNVTISTEQTILCRQLYFYVKHGFNKKTFSLHLLFTLGIARACVTPLE